MPAMLAWENIRHFATPPLVSPWNDVWETSAEIPYWWRVTIQIWVVLLIGWSKFPIQFGQSEATSSVWNFCAQVIRREPVVVWQSVGCFLRLLNCHAGYPYLGAASNNWRAICKEIPSKKKKKFLNEALQLRCGRNDCKQGILASQAKGHFLLWLKITWFLNVHVQLYM